MNNQELIKKVQDKAQIHKQEEIIEEEKIRYLIFRIEDNHYAFPSIQVREINIGSQVFYIPFVPEYIRGLINRHGNPYTVFDLLLLFEGKTLNGEKFLIMNLVNDHVAFLISDVVEILSIPKSKIHNVQTDQVEYFKSSFTAHEKEVFIIDIESLLERLSHDLQ